MRLARSLKDHLGARAPALAAVVVLAAVHATRTAAPPDRTPTGVADLLGVALRGHVEPEEFIWERSGGATQDFLLGRRLLFIGQLDAADGPPRRELFRARVRVTPGGQPVAVATVHPLTDTPFGLEEQLIARGHHAAFVTRALGRIAAVTLLDLSGDPTHSAHGERSWMGAWSAWLDTGDAGGIARIDVTFDAPPESILMELTDEDLVLAVGPTEIPVAVRLSDGVVRTGAEDPFGVEGHPVPSVAGGLADFAALAADLLWRDREASRDAYDWARRWAPRPELGRVGPDGPVAPIQKAPLAAIPGGFPPHSVDDIVGWELRGSPGAASVPGALAPLATAAVPLDSEADGPPVVLVAMDMRQLELRYAAGLESPPSQLAANGRGLMSSGGAPPRIVAAFLGGTPRRWHHPHGAISEGRVLVMPEPGLPTIAIDRSGVAAFGLWPSGGDGWEDFLALRQGAPLTSSATPDRAASRVGLCADQSGHLIYAWARQATRGQMANALAPLACAHWLELGADVDRAGFVTIEPRADGSFETLALHPELPPPHDHFDDPASTERFYLVLRDNEPTVALPAGAAWAPDPGRQPAPSWIPSIHKATVTNLGVPVTLHSFAPGHFEWKIRAGTKERSHRMGDEFELGLQPELAQRLVASIRIGNGRRRRTRGLTIDGSTGHRFRGEAGMLWVDGRRLIVSASRQGGEPGRGDATELPLTAEHGEATRISRVLGARRMRAALCALPDGRVLLASAEFDSHEATTKTLLEAGCAITVALDRGTHDESELWRASGAAPPRLTDTSTTLHVLESPMDGQLADFDR